MPPRFAAAVPLSLLLLACGGSTSDSSAPAGSTGPARAAAPQVISIDGSSTVFPISEAVAEEFQAKHKARVTIGVSGTGGGFKKFCREETAITGASRPIKPSEVELCKENGVEYVELPVAYDGIAVVVNKENAFVDKLTVSELKTMWSPEAQESIGTWSQVRSGWPDEELHLFGPGVDSGTYDYFTKAIVGKEHSSRGDFTSSEDDNVLVQGVKGDKSGLAFLGFAYYAENQDDLKVVPIVDDVTSGEGAPAVVPSLETVGNATYQPLSRPIFVYVSKKAAERAEVAAFVEFYLGREGRRLVGEVGYIPLPDSTYELASKRFTDRVTGSVFGGGGSTVGASVEAVLKGGS